MTEQEIVERDWAEKFVERLGEDSNTEEENYCDNPSCLVKGCELNH